MTIMLVNGSPKRTVSASAAYLNHIESRLPKDAVIRRGHATDIEPSVLSACDAIVFAYPLYTDSVPGHLLRLLEQLDESGQLSGQVIYAVANNGFFEPEQCTASVEVLQHWCGHTGLRWGQAVCIGAGAVNQHIPNMEFPLFRRIREALNGLASNVAALQSGETQFESPQMPKAIYMTSAHRFWRQEAKKNGLDEDALSSPAAQP